MGFVQGGDNAPLADGQISDTLSLAATDAPPRQRTQHVPACMDMRPLSSDAFTLFAREHGLTLTSEPLYSAPRDVGGAPAEMEQQYLVRLSRANHSDEVQLVFAEPLAREEPPTVRDVLWWLAGDAWAIERAGGTIDKWAATHGYAPRHAATTRLFERHVMLASSVRVLLGDDAFSRLIATYESEVRPPSVRERIRGLAGK